ncbi:MAG TPA: hypothetical protein DCO72_10730 [Ruminococcus sp.]|nr:hypothetical protein [Ruminococcus sp.]
MNETTILSVHYSKSIRRLIHIGLIIFAIFAIWNFGWISIPFLLAMGFSIWYMESFGLDFEPETGNLCYHTALSKPYYFHVSEIKKISFQNIRTKSGERLFLSIHPPYKQILIILGEPSNSGGFDETWDSYTNTSELLDFLQRYQKTEGT